MDKQKEVAAIFKELSLENQGTLLVYARLSQVAEQAVKRELTHQQRQEYPMQGAPQCEKIR
ncbi:MAG: hypothetical protein LBC51_09635 [Treponema sp.]|jgi:hypothetical protein|nr:hypothetical protein [Treponema sp.]